MIGTTGNRYVLLVSFDKLDIQGQTQFQKYAFEYIPGKAAGAIAWFVGEEETFRMTGKLMDVFSPHRTCYSHPIRR